MALACLLVAVGLTAGQAPAVARRGVAVPWAVGLPALPAAVNPANDESVGTATPHDVWVPRLDASGLLVDGRVDEDLWRAAAAVRGLTRALPVEGGAGFGEAEFRLFYDIEALYVGARIRQPPGALRAHNSPRDQLGNDDTADVFLKPILEGDVSYLLRVNPLGIQRDVLSMDPEVPFPSWDGVWDSAGALLEDGYSVEMRIPFKTLRLSGGGAQTWGIGLAVFSGSNAQYDMWPPFSLDRGYQVQQLGRLRGIEGIQVGHRLEAIPSLVGRAAGAAAPGADFRWNDRGWVSLRRPGRVDPGVDLQYGITSSITASATLNPDFSQVEADPDQLDYNLRYPLLLQEKRPFFLEGLSAFETPVPLLYTRSINDPAAGLKVTGKHGPISVGILTALDQDPPPSRVSIDPSRATRPSGFDDTTGKNALISLARIGLDLGKSGRVGLLFADKELLARSDGARRAQHLLAAMDYRATWSNVHHLTLQAGGSSTGSVGGSALTGGFYLVNVKREDRNLFWEVETGRYDAEFRAETSDLARVACLPSQAGVAYKVENPMPLLAFARPELTVANVLDDQSLTTLDWSMRPGITLQGTGNATVVLSGVFGREYYGGTRYRVTTGTAQVDAALASWLELSLGTTGGTRINYDPADPFLGRAVDASGLVRVLPNRTLQLEGQYVKSLFWRPNGARANDVDLARIKLLYHLDASWSVRLIAQLNGFRSTLSSSAMLSYAYRPGTAFYLGYQEAQPVRGGTAEPTQRQVYVKMSYLASL